LNLNGVAMGKMSVTVPYGDLLFVKYGNQKAMKLRQDWPRSWISGTQIYFNNHKIIRLLWKDMQVLTHPV